MTHLALNSQNIPVGSSVVAQMALLSIPIHEIMCEVGDLWKYLECLLIAVWLCPCDQNVVYGLSSKIRHFIRSSDRLVAW